MDMASNLALTTTEEHTYIDDQQIRTGTQTEEGDTNRGGGHIHRGPTGTARDTKTEDQQGWTGTQTEEGDTWAVVEEVLKLLKTKQRC